MPETIANVAEVRACRPVRKDALMLVDDSVCEHTTFTATASSGGRAHRIRFPEQQRRLSWFESRRAHSRSPSTGRISVLAVSVALRHVLGLDEDEDAPVSTIDGFFLTSSVDGGSYPGDG
jgi:hypothetical protein